MKWPNVIPYRTKSEEFTPELSPDVFVAPTAFITGRVTIGKESSVFFGASLRGDIQRIIVGERTNVQDNAVIHTSRGLHDCVIGNEVTIGHAAVLHGCIVRDRCIIGMGSIILDDAEIGENCIIGANTLVTMNTKIPPGSLAIGSPAKVVRNLSERELKELKDSAESYRIVSRSYLKYFEESAALK